MKIAITFLPQTKLLDNFRIQGDGAFQCIIRRKAFLHDIEQLFLLFSGNLLLLCKLSLHNSPYSFGIGPAFQRGLMNPHEIMGIRQRIVLHSSLNIISCFQIIQRQCGGNKRILKNHSSRNLLLQVNDLLKQRGIHTVPLTFLQQCPSIIRSKAVYVTAILHVGLQPLHKAL